MKPLRTPAHSLDPSLYSLKGIVIIDSDGRRVLAKYYDPKTLATSKEQRAFEKTLFQKTRRVNEQILMIGSLIVVYKSSGDLFFYVIGSSHENELLLMSSLQCLYDSVSGLLKKPVEKKLILANLSTVMLALDEICDGGIILEFESSLVVKRVALRSDDVRFGDFLSLAD